MMAWVGAVLLVLAVLGLVKVFGVVAHSRRAIALAQASFGVISDRALPEETKEEVLQRNAVQLLKLFLLLLVLGAAAFLLPLGGLWVADHWGVLSWDAVLTTTLSWPFLSATVFATIVVVVVARRRRPPSPPAAAAIFENRYSPADRWLHQIAFATAPVQVAMARAEERVYRRRLAAVRVERPVFITALPRAGTTLLLNLCATGTEFVTHTYRQMPFVLTPLWWESFSRRFRVEDAPRERAHGDGLLVSADSPEALEEMLWLTYWPEHYRVDRIVPWTSGEASEGFLPFFTGHMRKLAALAPEPAGVVRRYLSKNNGNVARISWLAQALPEARFVVPFRPPLQHAASLRRQHLNFLAIHERDPFARQYMAGIGHFDFGANLRPIDFGGWVGQGQNDPAGLDFWLRYWIATYREVLAQVGTRVRLVDFDRLCTEPAQELGRVTEFLEVQDGNAVLANARDVRAPRAHEVDLTTVSAASLTEARALHGQLVAVAAE
jgi:hypothetical protein